MLASLLRLPCGRAVARDTGSARFLRRVAHLVNAVAASLLQAPKSGEGGTLGVGGLLREPSPVLP